MCAEKVQAVKQTTVKILILYFHLAKYSVFVSSVKWESQYISLHGRESLVRWQNLNDQHNLF